MEQVLARHPDGLARLIDARLKAPDYPSAVTLALTELGYDALEIHEDSFTPQVGGNQIVVFAPKQVVVIDEASRRPGAPHG